MRFTPRSPFAAVPMLAVLCAAALFALLACGKKESNNPPAAQTPAVTAPRVVGVELGNELKTDNRVAEAMTTFAMNDVIYVAVMTEGNSPSAAVTARWTYEDGQPVNETTRTVVLSGPATTEFHVSKPGGWPTGKYKVEILLNGASARTAEFDVR